MIVYGKQTMPQFVSWHCQDNEAREKIGDREASRGRGCPHYMKNLIQIKEINLDFREMNIIVQSENIFCSLAF